MSPLDLLRARAIARAALLNLVGLLLLVAAGALGFLDARADGQLALSTWAGVTVLAAFGGWLLDRQLLERFIGWGTEQGKRVASAIAAAKQPPAPPAGGSP